MARQAVLFGARDASGNAILALIGEPTDGSPIEVTGSGESGDTVSLFADGGATPDETDAAKPTRAASSGFTVDVGPVRSNLLNNGSFETPVIPSATYDDLRVGGEPLGFDWTITTNTVDIVSQGVFGWTAPAFAGKQWLDLVGFGSTGGVEQNFATTPGGQYTLSFEYANNPGALPSSSADVTVRSGAGTPLSRSVTHDTSTGADYHWTAFDAAFTATGTSATLAFNETVGGGNGGIFLDAVSVAPVVPAPQAVLFSALDKSGVDGLWVTDGTAAGTH